METFSNFFAEIEAKVASKIEATAKTFEVYLKKVDILQPEYPLSINEFKKAFFSLQTNKSQDHNEISFNVIKSCFGYLSKILLHIFRLSLEQSIFADDLKTATVTTIFKASDKNDFGNYWAISVLFCFSKIPEKIMYKRLFNHLSEHNLLFKNSLVFIKIRQRNMQLLYEINDKFENNCFILGIFIYHSEAFDTVNHEILISKLNSGNYGVKMKNLSWFKSYLETFEQYLNYNNDVTNLPEIKYGVPQG